MGRLQFGKEQFHIEGACLRQLGVSNRMKNTELEVCSKKDVILILYHIKHIKNRIEMLFPDGLKYEFLAKVQISVEGCYHNRICTDTQCTPVQLRMINPTSLSTQVLNYTVLGKLLVKTHDVQENTESLATESDAYSICISSEQRVL